MSVKLQELENVTKLSPRVIRILGLNPGPMTLQGTNTYLLGTGEERILIDAGEGKEGYIPLLQKVLEDEKCYIKEILITHYHYDHTAGLPSLLQEVKTKTGDEISVFKLLFHLDDTNIKFRQISEGEIFRCEGATVKYFHTPGHTDDHLCFWLDEENAVISGDCILGEGTSVFQELGEYMKSLKKILELSPNIIYPAHGPVIHDSNDRITHYINHRLQREAEILNVLQEVNASISTKDLVLRVYKNLPEGVFRGAVNNVNLHLKKLQLEGKVTLCNGNDDIDTLKESCCSLRNEQEDLMWQFLSS